MAVAVPWLAAVAVAGRRPASWSRLRRRPARGRGCRCPRRGAGRRSWCRARRPGRGPPVRARGRRRGRPRGAPPGAGRRAAPRSGSGRRRARRDGVALRARAAPARRAHGRPAHRARARVPGASPGRSATCSRKTRGASIRRCAGRATSAGCSPSPTAASWAGRPCGCGASAPSPTRCASTGPATRRRASTGRRPRATAASSSREDTWERGDAAGDPARLRAGHGLHRRARSKLDHALAAALALTRVARQPRRPRHPRRLLRPHRAHRARPLRQPAAAAPTRALYDLEARPGRARLRPGRGDGLGVEPRRATVVLLTSVVDLAAAELLREALLAWRGKHRPVLVNLEDPELCASPSGVPDAHGGGLRQGLGLEILLANRRLGRAAAAGGIAVAAAAADQLAWRALESYLSASRPRRAVAQKGLQSEGQTPSSGTTGPVACTDAGRWRPRRTSRYPGLSGLHGHGHVGEGHQARGRSSGGVRLRARSGMEGPAIALVLGCRREQTIRRSPKGRDDRGCTVSGAARHSRRSK